MGSFFHRIASMARRTNADDPGFGSIFSFLSGQPKAGISVNEEIALTNSAVFAAISLISNSVSMLPWGVYRKRVEGGKIYREQQTDLLLDDILSSVTNTETSSYNFRKTLTGNGLGWGNGYAEIERSRSGEVGALWQIDPARVNPDRDSRGRLIYDIANGGAANTVLAPDRVFHLKDFSSDGIVGKSRIRLAREAIAHGLAMETFGATLFGNGANFSGFLKHPGQITKDAREKLLASIKEKFVGPGKANKLGILWEGMEFIKTTIAPEEAQFLESRQFHVADIARWFNLPPHKIGDLSRATFNNIEEMNRETVNSAYMPWIIAWEQEANIKLLTREQRQDGFYTKMNVNALLRGDVKSRAEFYKTMQEYGDFSINEVRAFEEMNPIDNGDIHTVQVNRVSLDRLAADGTTAQMGRRSSDQ